MAVCLLVLVVTTYSSAEYPLAAPPAVAQLPAKLCMYYHNIGPQKDGRTLTTMTRDRLQAENELLECLFAA